MLDKRLPVDLLPLGRRPPLQSRTGRDRRRGLVGEASTRCQCARELLDGGPVGREGNGWPLDVELYPLFGIPGPSENVGGAPELAVTGGEELPVPARATEANRDDPSKRDSDRPVLAAANA